MGDWITSRTNTAHHPHKPKTRKGYEDSLRLHIGSADYGIAHIEACNLDRLALRKFFEALEEEAELGASARRAIHSLLHCAFDLGVEHGIVDVNPVVSTLRPSARSPRIKELDDEQVMQLLDYFLRQPEHQARWMVALFMGLRPGEATAIEVADIDWERAVLKVHQQLQQDPVTKTLNLTSLKSDNSERELPIPQFVMNCLRERRHELRRQRRKAGGAWKPWTAPDGRIPDFLFTQASGQPIRPRLDTTIWKRILIGAGLTQALEAPDACPKALPISRYACRHYAATWMLAHGIQLADVSRYLGHADVALTMRTYVAKKLPNMRSIAEQMDRGFGQSHSREVEELDDGFYRDVRTGLILD